VNAPEFFLALDAAIAPQIAAGGGLLSVLATEADAFELLSISLTGWRVVILFEGTTVADTADANESATAELAFRALVQVPKDFIDRSADSLLRERIGAAPPLLVLSNVVRGLVCRAIAPGRDDFDNNEGIRFLSERPYRPGGEIVNLHAQDLSFVVTISLDAPAGSYVDLFPSDS
jgi:hypothetical protein